MSNVTEQNSRFFKEKHSERFAFFIDKSMVYGPDAAFNGPHFLVVTPHPDKQGFAVTGMTIEAFSLNHKRVEEKDNLYTSTKRYLARIVTTPEHAIVRDPTGQLDEQRIGPGEWLVRAKDEGAPCRMSDKEFKARFERI